MEDLVTWLRAGYDAEERVARAALAAAGVEAPGAFWTPERVLLDLVLKRHILDLHRPADPASTCSSCTGESWPCLTVRLLAAPYADRPGFRVHWRP